METDVEDNGIQLPSAASEAEEGLGPLDLPGDEEVVEEFVTPVEAPGRGVASTDMSLLLPSVPSTNKISDLLSRNKSPLSQPTFMTGDMTGDLTAYVSSMPEEIRLKDLTLTGGFVNVGVEYARNSTTSFLESPNETVLQSASYWSPEEMGAVVIVSLMVPFILLSNIVVIISVVRFRRLHTPTNYFITSLAAVDIFVALATPFGIVVEVFNFGGAVRPEDVVICLLPNRILMMACGVSVLTLAAIAYDRQTALVSPLEYISIMTYKKVAAMVSLTWVYSALIAWLPLMAGWYNLPSEDSPCSANLIHGKAPVLFLAAIFVPSCVAIFVCYFRIFMVARHHAKAIAAVEFAVHRHLQVKFMIKDTKYAKTLALVIGAFLLLWLPYLIFIFVQTIIGTTFNVWIQTYLILLPVFNSGINPWLYAFKNNELRAAFRRLFKEICRNKLCNFSDRRTSLISAISGTPRLSRTDSRIASIIPEVTLCVVDEKLKQSLDSLGEKISESKQGGDGKRQRRQSMIDLMSAQSSAMLPRWPHRYATSCSNLETLGGAATDRTDSLPRSRSVCADMTLTHEAAGHCDTDIGEMGEGVSAGDESLAGQVSSEIYANDDNNSECGEVGSRQPATISSTARTPPTRLMLLSLPPVFVQLSLPPSSRRSSATDSSTSVFSVSDLAGQPKHYHHTSLPDSPTSPTPHPVAQRQHLRYTHSVDFLKEAALPAVSWTCICCQGSLSDASPHAYTQRHYSSIDRLDLSSPQIHQNMLTHTHSCPIFEPIPSYRFLLPQLCSSHSSHYLRKVASALLEDRLDFVSRIHREADITRRDQYVV